MANKQLKIDAVDVVIGMFVSGLDRPWSHTPFPIHGFYVRDLSEVKQLKIHCDYIFIDPTKGVVPDKNTVLSASAPLSKAPRSRVKVAPLKINKKAYNHEAFIDEMEPAKKVYKQALTAVDKLVFISSFTSSKPFSMKAINRAAVEMVNSILRNPDTLAWLSRIYPPKQRVGYLIRTCILGLVFGRYLGLSKGELNVLAVVLLVKDIGKFYLSEKLLEKQQRSFYGMPGAECFVKKGVEIIQQCLDVPPKVAAIVHAHRERLNGSGFPQGMQGDDIPLLAKIAGLVTFYDAVCHPGAMENPIPPSQVVALLNDIRGVAFQDDLVDEFIQAIGLYPTGTLVKLSGGDIAMVMEQNFERRLKPRAMVVLDNSAKAVTAPYVVDLFKGWSYKNGTKQSANIEIIQDLDFSQYKINFNQIRASSNMLFDMAF